MGFIKKCLRVVKTYLFHMLSWLYTIRYPMKENKVCFLSDVREVMGGNLKYVYDYLEDKDYERVIEFKADRRVRRTRKQKFQLLYNLTTSHYILLDDYSTAIAKMKVRKGQEIVQLWHGPGAYKKFGWSRQKGEGNIHNLRLALKKRLPFGHRNYTKAIVTGPHIEWCFREAFDMKAEQVKATGFPRTDEFFDQKYIEKTTEAFYNEYPELKDKKIILFAPTYRGERVAEASYDFSQLDLQELYDEFHEDYVFMIKWHPAIYNNIDRKVIEGPDFDKYKDFFVDFSKYRDINDLLLVCHCLITDYSSMIFDYVLLDKPIIYFTYDLEEYAGKDGRGLYFDFEDYVYGSVAMNQKELIQMIRNDDLMTEKRKVFYDKFMGACDGHATERTCRWIFGEEQ